MLHSSIYETCIEACLRCVALCNQCVAACLLEDDVKKMARCIRLDLECAVICRATAEIMGLGGQFQDDLYPLCEEACTACGEECSRHPHMPLCRLCAESCRACAAECRRMRRESG